MSRWRECPSCLRGSSCGRESAYFTAYFTVEPAQCGAYGEIRPRLGKGDDMSSSTITRREALRALVAAALTSTGALAVAQPAYPNRPIRLVVPYPPGALTDVLARTIAERMSAGLGQPVVVENKPGAGTLVGAELVAKSPPDGYTLLMATSTTLGISPAL